MIQNDSRFVGIRIIPLDLPIAAFCMEFREYWCVAQQSNALIHSWKGVLVAYSDSAYLPILEAKLQQSVLLWS